MVSFESALWGAAETRLEGEAVYQIEFPPHNHSGSCLSSFLYLETAIIVTEVFTVFREEPNEWKIYTLTKGILVLWAYLVFWSSCCHTWRHFAWWSVHAYRKRRRCLCCQVSSSSLTSCDRVQGTACCWVQSTVDLNLNLLGNIDSYPLSHHLGLT